MGSTCQLLYQSCQESPIAFSFSRAFAFFLATFSTARYPWDQLNTRHRVQESLHSEEMEDWFGALSSETATHPLILIRKILVTLECTGISLEGDHLMVAWP